MHEVLEIELCGKSGRWTEAAFPLTDYELLDVLDRLSMQPEEQVKRWEVCCYDDRFGFLSLRDLPDISLLELNALTRKLEAMDEYEASLFAGLVAMEAEKREGPCELAALIDFAYNTDCCELLVGIMNDERLGALYLENGSYPELTELPDSVVPLLDLKAIGRKMRIEQGGVFTEKGYVVQMNELKEVYKDLDLTLKNPEYTILLEVSRGSYCNKKTLLRLPATPTEMDAALDAIGARDWSMVNIRCMDCCAPAFIPHIRGNDNVAHINRLAQRLQTMNAIQRSKYKAVLESTKVDSVLAATQVADALDEYLYLPQYISPEDVGRDALEKTVGELILPYVNLYAYGEALIKAQGSVLTDHGLVSRRDRQPVQDLSTPMTNDQSEMEMR